MSETQKGFISEINSGIPEIERASIVAITEQLIQNKSFINKEAVLSKIADLKASLKDGLSFKAVDPDYKIRSEYFNDAFVEKVLDLSKLQHIKFSVTVILSDNPIYWKRTLAFIDLLKSNNIQFSPQYLISTPTWTSNYTTKFYQTFNDILSQWSVDNTPKFANLDLGEHL